MRRETELMDSLSEKESVITKIDTELKRRYKESKRKTESTVQYKPNVPKLNENQFEEWKLEVEVMMKSGMYCDDILKQAIRNSLTGNTRKILLTVKSNATTKDILKKLESVYGNVRTAESVIEEFYATKQTREESVSAWGLHLEGLVQTAIEKGALLEDQREDMLKNRFWKYLYKKRVEERKTTGI